MDDSTRTDYIRAVQCLASKPPKMDRSLARGAVNRLDDFTYIHINQTNIIHQSVSSYSVHSFPRLRLKMPPRVTSSRGIVYSSGKWNRRYVMSAAIRDTCHTGTTRDSPMTSQSQSCSMGP